MTKQRTHIEDINRSLYDIVNSETPGARFEAGLTPDIVREISARKHEPAWMLSFRLKSLDLYNQIPEPTWGPSLAGLDMATIVTYIKPDTEQQSSWDSLPDDVKNTFERLNWYIIPFKAQLPNRALCIRA